MTPTNSEAGAAAPDDVCMLVEGTYPYVAGGVSAWVHDIIKGHPELRFSVFNIGSLEVFRERLELGERRLRQAAVLTDGIF